MSSLRRSSASVSGLLRRGRAWRPITRLSRRDLQTLAWVGEQYAVRLDQLEALLGRGQRTAQRMAARLRAAGLTRVRPLFAGEPAWLWLTPAGARECPSGFGAWEPKLGL